MDKSVSGWIGVLALTGVAVLVGWSLFPHCHRTSEPRIEPKVAWVARDAWRAGAAVVPVSVSYPVVIAGYPPVRHDAHEATLPPMARAVVLRSGNLSVGLVSLDLLTMPGELAAEIQRQGTLAGLDDVLTMATHAHSSLGGYASDIISEVAGTGRYSPRVRKSLVDAAVAALRTAQGRVEPVRLEMGEGSLPEVVSRNEVSDVDHRLTRLVLRGAHAPVAQLLLLAAHPTLAPRMSTVVDPDYPGWLAHEAELAGEGVTLVLQSAVGNANLRAKGAEAPKEAGAWLHARAQALSLKPLPEDVLSLVRVTEELPEPDAHRLVPRWLSGAGANVLCASSPGAVPVTLLHLGPERLLFVPVEPTMESARTLEQAAGASRVVGLAGAYVGYLDSAKRVLSAGGESKRQYFGPELEAFLAEAAAAARTTQERIERAR